MLEKPTERDITTDNCLSMVTCKVLKQLQLLEGRKFDDQDIQEDIQYLDEMLETSVQDLRFVQSGRAYSAGWTYVLSSTG